VSHHVIFITVYAQNVLIQHERKLQTLTPLANSRFNNLISHNIVVTVYRWVGQN